jgi:hypothetical protein
MKFNFKKITSVLASAVMLGSTIGVAAAANYPAPFIKSGASDVAVVVGLNAASSDYLAVLDVGQSLQTELSKQTATGGSGGGSSASGGDSVEFVGAGDTYLTIGAGISDVITTDLDKNDMPNLLADGTYRNADNTDYNYQQTIRLANRSVSFFADSDYNDKEPTLGFRITKNQAILNYTLDFTKDVQATVSSTDITGLENTDIVLLGKEYRIVDASNASSISTITLLGGSLTGVLNLDEEKTETLDGKEYIVKLVYVDSDEVQFEVNGERTTKLNKGQIYKLSDGINIGVKDLSYQNFAGGVMTGEYTLGAEKLKIEDNNKLEMDDEDVDQIDCFVVESDIGGKYLLQEFTLQWVADDEYFLTPDQEIEMPALKSVKYTMGDFYFPGEEMVEINPDGTDTVEVKIPVKDGIASFNILYGSDGVNWTLVGKDNTGRLATSYKVGDLAIKNASAITFNETTDEYFVASYNSSTVGESYLLSAKTKKSNGINYTTIKNEVTGTNVCEDVQAARTCKIGNVVITVESNQYDEDVNYITAGTGVTFDKVFTPEGLVMELPWLNDSRVDDTSDGNSGVGTSAGEITAVTIYGNASTQGTYYPNGGMYDLVFREEDKDGNLGAGGNFNVTLGWTSSKTTVNAVSEAKFEGGQDLEIGNTDVFVGYTRTKVATKSEFDTSGTQDSVIFTYHGGQSYAPVFLAAPAVTVASNGGSSGSVSELGSVTYKDSEIDSAKSKNLIVVGGSCINSVAAEILGGAYCGADFTDATGIGADQFLVKVVDSPYTTGKVAMLVAGYEAADTKKAVTYLINEAPATDVGTELKKVTATYADVDVE